MIIEIMGHKVDLEDGDRIIAHIRKEGSFEPLTLKTWVAMCEDSKLVFDVGAYTGLFSILAAKIGCDVVAFEPLLPNIRRLRSNIKRNKVENRIDVVEAAASDRTAMGAINYNPRVTFTAGATLQPSGPRSRKQNVRIVTLDSLNLAPGAIKIDVERHEDAVLRGAERTITTHRPQMIVEALDQEQIGKVQRLLPQYKQMDYLDRRNMVMMPG